MTPDRTGPYTSWKDRLRELNACPHAMERANQYDDAQQAWDECPRGDWMLWWLGHEAGEPWSDSRRPLVGCAATCASLAPTGDGEHELARAWAIGAALRWSEGGSSEELRAAYAASSAASYAADAAYAVASSAASYAADAAYAVASAGDAYAVASSAASYAAYYAADAAYYAAYYAADAAYYAADAAYYAAREGRRAVLRECADIVREWFPHPPYKERA
jgi:hypothetical protein